MLTLTLIRIFFFECKFSDDIWSLVRDKAPMHNVSSCWHNIVSWLSDRARSCTLQNVMARLIVVASVYFIWQERNNRSFSNHARPPDKIVDTIFATVQYRILGLKVKTTARVLQLLDAWHIKSNMLGSIEEYRE